MQIRFFSLLFCLLAAPVLKASPYYPNDPNKHTPSTMEESCNLPAPTNFTIDAWGPDWVHLKWDLTNPGYQHRINVYSCVDGSLIKTLVAGAGVTDTTIFFTNPPLNIFTYEIKAICTSGDSPNSAWINCIGPGGSGVIHELVVSGFSPEHGESTCTLSYWPDPNGGGSERCFFSDTGISTFEVREINNKQHKRAFGIERLYDEGSTIPHYKAHLAQPYPGTNSYRFYASNQAPPAIGSEYEVKEVKVGVIGETPVAVFVVEVEPWTGESFLKRIAVAYGYEVARISDYSPGEKPTGNRDGQGASTTHPATASPNPFYNQLDVFPGKPTAENIHLQMYNLSGQKVLDRHFTGGQEQYALSTENLSPGFYLLRVEADGEVQTLKVVKSE